MATEAVAAVRTVARRGSWHPGVPLWLSLGPGLAILAAFSLVPLLLVGVFTFWRSSLFGLEPAWTLDNYRRFFDSPVYVRLLVKSLRTAVTVTLLTLLLAYPLAYFMARVLRRGRVIGIILLMIPFWTSYLVRTFGWLPILGRRGLLNQLLVGAGIVDRPLDVFLYNEFSVHLGLLYVYLPFAAIPIFLSLDRLDSTLLDAAADLGAGPARTFWRVTVPLTLPGILGGGLMVFLLGFGAYVTPALLGGPSGILFGNLVAFQFGPTNNWAFGATLAFVMLGVVVGVLAASSRWIGLRGIFVRSA